MNGKVSKTCYRIMFFAFAIIVLLTSSAWCSEFKADVVIDKSGKSYSGTAYVKDNNIRYELKTEEGGEVIVRRADFGAQWTIYPGNVLYSELWNYINDDFIMPEMIRMLDEIAAKELVGTKKVAGMLCDIYLYKYHERPLKTLTVYRARELDFPIKVELEANGFSLTKEYKNIEAGPIDDSLFTLPPGSTMLK